MALSSPIVRSPRIAPPAARAADPGLALAELEACLRDEILEPTGDTHALADWLRRRAAAAPPRDPARRARRESRTAGAALAIVEALLQHAQQVQAGHALRREALARGLARLPAAGGAERAAVDGVRAELADRLQALERTLREHWRRTLASESGVQARMTAEVARIGDADLAREVSRKEVGLALRREFMADLQHAMRELVEQDLGSMAAQADAVLVEIEVLVERSLREEFGGSPAAPMPRWQTGELLDRVADAMQFNPRYRGALPRRGFLQRLAEGRKSVFAVLMFVSLFGSFLGFNWRTHPVLGWLFMAGFIAAVGWTFRSWKDDERERIEEELEKAREQLATEARRLLGDVYRELQSALGEALEALRRSAIGSVEDAARAAAARAAREAQAQRDAAQSALREIELAEGALAARRQGLLQIQADLRGVAVARAAGAGAPAGRAPVASA
jgi:hypothetical protein